MFTLTLVTPEKKLITNLEVDEVLVPGFRGELNILPGHAPLMTTLHAGILRYRKKGATDFGKASISWGYCEVNPTGIKVLADTAELPSEIDKHRAEKAFKEAQDRLMMANIPVEEMTRLQRKIQRAQARLELMD
ncbi:MAG: ATP synthase F1 subunit epsilon [Pseudobdellovibrionaceae bacterium]|nr:ATP synthase F1 subunit epsilon [Bdellovibrionales bacterium]USN46863.1 MAG: ATP synthase F1 subunit epsilon [Pseudobdellovibrionaceae bacterium]